jgi:hypothetical protein
MRVVPRPVVPGSIDTTASAARAVSAGDQVRITLRDGRLVSFKVLVDDSAGIVAVDNSRYEMADIVTLERKGLSGTRTVILVAAGIATFVLVLYAVAVASLAGNF